MTRRTAAIAAFLVAFVAGPAIAQPSAGAARETHFGQGRAALDAHDPTTAIHHFEQVDTSEGREWLAVALMMESRSPSDEYVERAFQAARDARAAHSPQSRRELAAALRPGEMVIAYLVGETQAYAWAFDRGGFIGYALPPRSELTTAVDRVRAYLDERDHAGLERIAETLTPALLGPVQERLPQLKRLVFVPDGPLHGLRFGALPAGDGQPDLQDRVAIATADYDSLMDTIRQVQPSPEVTEPNRPNLALVVAVAVGLLAAAGIAIRLRR